MKYTLTLIAILFAQILLGQGKHSPKKEAIAQSITYGPKLEAEIDAIFTKAFPASSPGAAVLIAKGDSVLYRKAFGMANLELNVPMKPENVLQLASITKQFTSVAILMLMEQGKLSLQDPLSKYIPDFPRGNEITIHHLLNHTSGIKDYTRMPGLRAQSRLDISPEEIISKFKNLPLEFEPNEKWDYDNSGYVLLGHIIEQISGMSYADFIQQHIFDRLNMRHSYYADSYKIIPNRACGYHATESGFENAEFMSMTFPFAAGALMSNVDDMYLWNLAIQNNTLISEESKRLAFTNYKLANGKATYYGYGWHNNEIAGIESIEHTGGINGFNTSGIFIPKNKIYAIILSNVDGGKGVESYNIKAVSMLLGESLAEKTPLKLSEKEAQKWLGAYQFDDVVRFITYEDGALYSTREGSRPLKLEALSADEFRFEDRLTTYQFFTKSGKKQVIFSDRIVKSTGVETDKKMPGEKEAIHLPASTLAKYVGVYELDPAFHIEIELKEDRLFALANGQQAIELSAATESSFFNKEVGAQIDFDLDPEGKVTSLKILQAGNDLKGRKIK